MMDFYERMIKPQADELGEMLDCWSIPYIEISSTPEDFISEPQAHRHMDSRDEGRQLYCADCGDLLIDLDEEQDNEL